MQMQLQKDAMNIIMKEFKDFERIASKFIEKEKKKLSKEVKEKKPSGFAVPKHVSKELSFFMDKDNSEKLSRPAVTKFLMNYIFENKLQNPDKKTQILPDDKLAGLLGESAKNEVITYFTIQKYMNRHFIS